MQSGRRRVFQYEYRNAYREAFMEGFILGVKKCAINMLKLKLSLDVIQAATGLPLETIKQLAVENDISL